MPNIPASFNYIVQESVQFNNPVSESALSALGGSLNGLLSVLLPVGSIVQSMLTEAQFQAQIGNTNWQLADGRNVAGSSYQAITGLSNLPDLRSVILRGKDNGRGLNPNGDLALGTYTSDVFASHNHPLNDPGHSHTIVAFRTSGSGGVAENFPSSSDNLSTNPAFTGITMSNTGGAETAPKTVTVNTFIRVN